jgi:hypothetical protein
MGKHRNMAWRLAAVLLLWSAVSLGAMRHALAEDATTPKTGTYPAVNDLPPKPEKPGMSVDEQSKLKQDLIDAREHAKTSQASKTSQGKTSQSKTPAKAKNLEGSPAAIRKD